LLIDIEVRLATLGGDVANKSLTLREYTEKHLNDKIPDDQKDQFYKPKSSSQEIFNALTLHRPEVSHLSLMGISRRILKATPLHIKPRRNCLANTRCSKSQSTTHRRKSEHRFNNKTVEALRHRSCFAK
jgi:hypothetical protein